MYSVKIVGTSEGAKVTVRDLATGEEYTDIAVDVCVQQEGREVLRRSSLGGNTTPPILRVEILQLLVDQTKSEPEPDPEIQDSLPEYRRLGRLNGAAMIFNRVSFSSVRNGGTPLRVDVRHEGEDLHLAFTLPATKTQLERVVPVKMKRDNFLVAMKASSWKSFPSAAWFVCKDHQD